MVKKIRIKSLIKNSIYKVNLKLIGNKLRPVFIVGCGHSGTSIMLSLLDNHTDIYAVNNESKLFFKKEIDINAQVLKWYQQAKLENKLIIAEKTPLHIHKIDTIFNLFRNAKVILMMRDGRDVACSIKERTGSFEKGIDRWISDNEAGYKFWNDSRVRVVKLEDLTADADSILAKVCDFIGVKYQHEMLMKQGVTPKMYYTDKMIQKEQIETIKDVHELHNARRNWQINQRLFSDTSRWKEELSKEELDLFNEKAANFLELYGYSI